MAKDPEFTETMRAFDERVHQLRQVETENEFWLLQELVGDEVFAWPHKAHVFWVLQGYAVLAAVRSLRSFDLQCCESMQRCA